MIGVSSACTNPILYGFLNENFVKEFSLLCPLLGKLTIIRSDRNLIGTKKEEKTNLLTPNKKYTSTSTTPLLKLKSVTPISTEPSESASHPQEAVVVQDTPIPTTRSCDLAPDSSATYTPIIDSQPSASTQVKSHDLRNESVTSNSHGTRYITRADPLTL